MFHRALVLLRLDVTGTFSPSLPVVAMKSMMPCRLGDTPVAMLVQMTGDSIGVIVCRRPRTPDRESLPRLGSRPAASSGSRSEERRVGEEGRSRWAPDH